MANPPDLINAPFLNPAKKSKKSSPIVTVAYNKLPAPPIKNDKQRRIYTNQRESN